MKRSFAIIVGFLLLQLGCGLSQKSLEPSIEFSVIPSAEIGGTVAVIDPVKREVKKKITFEIAGLRREAIQPVGVNITRDGKTGFVALGPANRIAVVDGVTHNVTKYLLVGQRVWHMAFTPDEKYLLSTNGVSNDVSVIDVGTLRVIKTIQVGELPWGVTISP